MTSKSARAGNLGTDAPGQFLGLQLKSFGLTTGAPASRVPPANCDVDTRSLATGGIRLSTGLHGPLIPPCGHSTEPELPPSAGTVAGPAGSRLENTANKGASRGERYARRALLWRESSLNRLHNCGRARREGVLEVGVRLTDGAAGFSGLQSCGSVWACPVCSSKIQAQRREEVRRVCEGALDAGLSIGFGTLTLRHHRVDRLAALWDHLNAGWSYVTHHRKFREAAKAAGYVGMIRVVEVNWGANGWHVHIHFLVLCKGNAADLWAVIEELWLRAMTRRGMDALTDAQAFKVVTTDSVVEHAEYLAKGPDARWGAAGVGPNGPTRRDPASSVAWEVTGQGTKRLRSALGTEPAWALLDLVVNDGDADALDLWHEYEKGSHGRRQLTWSQGLRDMFGVEEVSDEEIAAEELSTRDDTLVLLDGEAWSAVVRTPAMLPQLLDAAEAGGRPAVIALLQSRGIPYRVPGG